MLCTLRTDYDPNHPTCKSCQKQGVKCDLKGRKKSRKQHHNFMKGNKCVCTRDLRTPNDWTNRMGDHGRKVYSGYKKGWLRDLEYAAFAWGEAKGKRRLTVVRFVPNKSHLMKDKTNREGSLKPLEDALVTLGVLIDDCDTHMERPDLEQVVDKCFPRVEITVEDI